MEVNGRERIAVMEVAMLRTKELCSVFRARRSILRDLRVERWGFRAVGLVGDDDESGGDFRVMFSILRIVSFRWVERSSWREVCCSVSRVRADC